MSPAVAMTGAEPAAEPIDLQRSFDPIPSAALVHTLEVGDRRVRFADTGREGWHALVLFGGLGTSAGAGLLAEFARSTREAMRLRLITIERAGFGLSALDPGYGYGTAAADALAVLDHLDVERFRIVGISGGGPYAAALAAAAPDRVVSLHLAAAAAGPLLAQTAAPLTAEAAASIVADPAAWWEYPAGSPVHRIPGFAQAAAAEGRRAFWLTAHGAPALTAEWSRLWREPLPDLSALAAPGYLYWGTDDAAVPPAHAVAWRRALPNLAAAREYPGGGHDVQYRHWDQLLLDAAGLGTRTLMGYDRRSWLVPLDAVPAWLEAGATLGLCCWSAGEAP